MRVVGVITAHVIGVFDMEAEQIKALADSIDNPNDLGILLNELLDKLDVMALDGPYDSPAFGDISAYEAAAKQISNENQIVYNTLNVYCINEWEN